tara:strand:- start:960 stop:1937 length:978 start_codon:yes stop_codon:yes gene_type:complete
VSAPEIHNILAHAPLLTELDSKIIEQLQEDGRRSFSAIARQLDANEKTVRSRVLHLLESGIVQITTVTEPAALGYHSLALLGIRTSPDHSTEAIAEQLASLSHVDYVVTSTGRYNLYAEVICKDIHHLGDVVNNQIGTVAGIVSVETYPYLSLYYQQAAFSQAAKKEELDSSGVRPREPDQTDREIISILSSDGRMPLQKVADQLNISEAQVRQRVNSMQSTGVLQIMGIVNPMNIGFRSVAWVSIKVSPGTAITAVAESLSKLQNITYVAICSGRFDIHAEIVCRDKGELLDVYDNRIRTVAGLQCVELASYISLHYKRLIPDA